MLYLGESMRSSKPHEARENAEIPREDRMMPIFLCGTAYIFLQAWFDFLLLI
jgi:hypothetical protein